VKKIKIEDISPIRIVGKDYKVNIVESLIRDQELLHGLCEPHICTISLSDSQDIQNQKDTIIHECAHAIAEAMGVDIPEQHILILGTGLYAWMRENPLLIKWIMQND
jgi:hypothetical protein